jgi:hypothetical protein
MYDEFGEYVEDAVMDDRSVTVSSDTESITSNQKKQRKMMEDLKKMDKGYNKITRMIDGKKKSIDVYSTSTNPGAQIRGAIGGSYYQGFRVGTRDEDIFFKVMLATGECSDSSTLFFDNPEQYERHLYAVVSPDDKEKWYKKFNEERNARS